MIAFLLGILLFAQGIPALSTDTGTITGTLKTSSGQPAPGVRMTAMAVPENLTATASAASFASLAATDDNGHFRLENIPPGRYYIAAGRVDLPTYFPGSLEMSKGTLVSVASNAVVTNIDFVMDESSTRPVSGSSNSSFTVSSGGLTMPVHVRMEGVARQPVFADGRSVMLQLTRTADQTKSEVPLNSSDINFPIPGSIPGVEYRVTVENLPAGFVVKSMIQESVDLLSDTLKITAKNFVPLATGATTSNGGISNIGMPMTPLEITLAAAPLTGSIASGVSVKGHATSTGGWFLSISGKPGILFEDGSFEFRGVAPGRHVILLQDKMGTPDRVLAASVVIGDKDLDDVLADDTQVLPVEIQFPVRTPPPGSIPLAWIHGRVADDASRNPVFGGVVTLTGKTKATFPIDSEGQFEIPRLLPGTYDLNIEGFQHAAVRQSVVVGDVDVQVNVSARATN